VDDAMRVRFGARGLAHVDVAAELAKNGPFGAIVALDRRLEGRLSIAE
jgi:hypothetical protein